MRKLGFIAYGIIMIAFIATLIFVGIKSCAPTSTPKVTETVLDAPTSVIGPQMHHLERRTTNYPHEIKSLKNSPTSAPTASPTEEPTCTPTPEPIATPTPSPTYVFMATAYSSAPEENGEWGAVDCKYGQPLPADAIAADLKILPYGTIVYIEGVGERIVVDTASQATIKKTQKMAEDRGAYAWIDLYMGDNKQNALDWGIKLVSITILEWGNG